ncbi:MAG: calcium-binding protein [Pseudorhodoplanes sp.]|nr:calcium-binding protein [Pseudorhodoplanes sp.]
MPVINIIGSDLPDVLEGNGEDEHIYGLLGNDLLIGNGGDDYLDGGKGLDTMQGGDGDDTYKVENAGDLVEENAGEGEDIVYSLLSYTLPANVENLHLEGNAPINGYGNDQDNIIQGNNNKNILKGGGGNDTLMGYGGADTMIGGSGDDVYWVGQKEDVVTEQAGQGTDWVYSSVSHTLAANVEHLVLTSGSGAINGIGNDLDNWLYGNEGSNALKGGGGHDFLYGDAGEDTMAGGTGDDTYVVDDLGDVVLEGANEGAIDLVASSVNHHLAANVERLQLLEQGGHIDGTGNGLDNVIYGNSFNNELLGLAGADLMHGGGGHDYVDGGQGADTMSGGAGNDTLSYAFSSAGVNISLVAGTASGGDAEGDVFDTFENLTGSGYGDHLVGDAQNSIMSGLAGNDTIEGRGGDDTLEGGGGADTFVFETDNHDTVTDFGPDDIIQFYSWVYSDFADVMAHAQQVGNDVVIAYNDNNSITLQNVNIGDLNANDFTFV